MWSRLCATTALTCCDTISSRRSRRRGKSRHATARTRNVCTGTAHACTNLAFGPLVPSLLYQPLHTLKNPTKHSSGVCTQGSRQKMLHEELRTRYMEEKRTSTNPRPRRTRTQMHRHSTHHLLDNFNQPKTFLTTYKPPTSLDKLQYSIQ